MGKNHGWPSDQKGETMDISLLSMDPRNCDKCGYEAESLYVLDGHTWEFHDDSIECEFCENTFYTERDLMKHKKEEHCKDPPLQPENADDQSLHLSCQLCDNKFVYLRELMVHKRRQHEEKINICWNYASGKCENVKIAGSCIQKEVKLFLNTTLVKKLLRTKINFYTTGNSTTKNRFKPVKMW